MLITSDRFFLIDVFILGSIEYYHITCPERVLPDLPNFVGYGYLKMDGWIAAPPHSHISIESSSEVIKDWF